MPGNKYESLARGLLDFPESSRGTVSRLFDIRRNTSSICPDFCGELKVPFAIRDEIRETRVIRDGSLRDFPCVPRPPTVQSFVRDHEFPRRRVCGDASCVSRVEGIFFAFPRSTRYFSSLTLSRPSHAAPSFCFPCTTLQNILSKTHIQGNEQGLNANKRCYEFIYDDHGGGVYSCSRLVPIHDPVQRHLSMSPSISRGNARQSRNPRRN